MPELTTPPPAFAAHTLTLMLGMPPANHPEWRAAFRLADAWDYAAGLHELAGDFTRAERYRQHASDIYEMLGAQCGEAWATPPGNDPRPAERAAAMAASEAQP
jgi:hypothetical protein